MKRGEITSSQIVTYTLIIVGFAILLFGIIFIIDIRKTSEDEVCRLSVLTRATSPEHAQRALPLKCTTKKICLSQKGETCEAYIGEENILNIDLPNNNEQAAEQIEGIVANAIYNCWNLMGQGKLDIFGGGKSLNEAIASAIGVDGKKSSCVICNRIALADDIQENEELLNQIDVNSYMEYKQAPGTTLTYLQAMTDNQMRSYSQKFEEQFTGTNAGTGKTTEEIGVIFMQIETEETPFEEATGAATGAGTFIIGGTAGLGALGGLLTLPGSIATAVGTAATGGFAAFQTWQNRQVSLAHCGELTSTEEALKGCSIVTTFDYHDVDKINNLCGRVEGTP